MPIKLCGLKEKAWGLIAFFLSTGLLIWLDQWTKSLAVKHLMGKPAIVLFPGIFELCYLENRGAAFGMFQGRQMFFFLVAVIVFFIVLFGLYRMPFTRHYLPLAVCMSLIVAGAAGNMIDRLTQQYVVDFLYFCLIDFPIFNVADAALTFGVITLILYMILDEKKNKKKVS